MKKSNKKLLFERMNYLNPDVGDIEETSEEDYGEGSMYKVQLKDISNDAQEFCNNISDNEEIPAWVQDKISLSRHYMQAITDWLGSKSQVDNNINEDVPSGDLVNEIQNLLYKYGYFPMTYKTGRIEFIKIDDDPIMFDVYINELERAWNEISLPFNEGKKSKVHKKKVNMKGYWGMDDDGDGIVDGASDGGFGGDGGGGE